MGLGDSGEKITAGEKTMAIIHRQEKTVDNSGRVLTFTHLYWKDSNGRGYLFEISPRQKNGLNKDLVKILASFKVFWQKWIDLFFYFAKV